MKTIKIVKNRYKMMICEIKNFISDQNHLFINKCLYVGLFLFPACLKVEKKCRQKMRNKSKGKKNYCKCFVSFHYE